MKNPFEGLLGGKREEAKKPEPVGPSFEELLDALPENEREELKSLKGIPDQLATSESEAGIEIEVDHLSESEMKAYGRYMALIKMAQDLLRQQKG